jgi:hypothetical protein
MHSFGRRRSRKSKKSSRRSRKNRRSTRKSRRGPRGGKIYVKPKGMSCKEFLSEKIAKNMREFKAGKLLSNGKKVTDRKQVLAISYSQVRTGNPRCKF